MRSAPLAGLLDQLTASWGQGLVWLGRHIMYQGDYGLSPDEATAFMRQCRIRVWLGSAEVLDAGRVLESLRHGCLPLQFVDEHHHADLAARLPTGLAAFTMALPSRMVGGTPGAERRAWSAACLSHALHFVQGVPPCSGSVPALPPDEVSARLDRGLSSLFANGVERPAA
jgi:hypothetical protein